MAQQRPESIDPSTKGKLVQLQLLRLIAASLVVVTHITFYILDRLDKTAHEWHAGVVGVPIFLC
jgi:exopolysaccharide production protein ExoZ